MYHTLLPFTSMCHLPNGDIHRRERKKPLVAKSPFQKMSAQFSGSQTTGWAGRGRVGGLSSASMSRETPPANRTKCSIYAYKQAYLHIAEDNFDLSLLNCFISGSIWCAAFLPYQHDKDGLFFCWLALHTTVTLSLICLKGKGKVVGPMYLVVMYGILVKQSMH